jgi:hypothetical protein
MSSVYRTHPVLLEVEQSLDNRFGGRADIVGLIAPGGRGAEIGVFTGIFSEYLLLRTKPSTFHMVDSWHLTYGKHFPDWGPYTAGGRLTTEAALEAARLRSASHPGAQVVVARSLDWIGSLSPGSLDWVYLDSSHTYQDTLAELHAISEKISGAGVILGDDAWTDRNSVHYGVFQAITEFSRTQPFELFRLDHGAQWALRRRL